MTTALDALTGQTLADTYRIGPRIGKGGMGSVFAATHARLPGHRFAIKVLSPACAENPELLARFRREAEIATSLGHEHIVRVHDFNVVGGVAYIAMELLDGEDLAARIARGPMAVDAVKRIVDQMASALDAAHRANIVHRDLKPQNVFLCRVAGRDDHVKLLDFGVSKVLDSTSIVTRDQALVGTPYYMSPEQAEGRVREIDTRTDIFALAAIIWEMLTGRMAFGAPNFSVALYKVTLVDPPDVHLVRPDLPPAVSMALRLALAKERTLRTSSVTELAAQLGAAFQGVMPAGALPPPAQGGTDSVFAVVSARPPSSGSLAVAATGHSSPPPQPSPAPLAAGSLALPPAGSLAAPEPPPARSRAWPMVALGLVAAAASATAVHFAMRPRAPVAPAVAAPPPAAPVPAPSPVVVPPPPAPVAAVPAPDASVAPPPAAAAITPTRPTRPPATRPRTAASTPATEPPPEAKPDSSALGRVKAGAKGIKRVGVTAGKGALDVLHKVIKK